MMKCVHLLLVLAGFCWSQTSVADTAAAFTDGTAFGKTNTGKTKGQITTDNATGTIPNYTTTDSASSYYLDGKGSLTAPAAGDVNNCTTTKGDADADAYVHGKCEGVRMIMQDPGKKNVMFPINKTTDPLMVKRNAVKADPDSYLGSLTTTGNYSGCVEKTITQPDSYTTEVCDQFLKRVDKTCQEILSVTVTKVTSCTGVSLSGAPSGGYYTTTASCGATEELGAVFTLNVAPPYQIHHHKWNSDYYGITRYLSKGAPFDVTQYMAVTYKGWQWEHARVVWDGVDTVTVFGNPGNMGGPLYPYYTIKINGGWQLNYNYTDTWDDQCAALKARLP